MIELNPALQIRALSVEPGFCARRDAHPCLFPARLVDYHNTGSCQPPLSIVTATPGPLLCSRSPASEFQSCLERCGTYDRPQAIKAARKSDYLNQRLKTPAPPLFFSLIHVARYPHFCRLPSFSSLVHIHSNNNQSTDPASPSTLTGTSASVITLTSSTITNSNSSRDAFLRRPLRALRASGLGPEHDLQN
jgi:hypothetical protein